MLMSYLNNGGKNEKNILNKFKGIDYEKISYAYDIDNRVLRVCKEAEENYLENKRIVKEIKEMKENMNKIVKSYSTCSYEDSVYNYRECHDNNQNDNHNRNENLIYQNDISDIKRDNLKYNFDELKELKLRESARLFNNLHKKSESDEFLKTFVSNRKKLQVNHNHYNNHKKCIACRLKNNQ